MNKVLSFELKQDKNGNDMKIVKFEGIDKGVFVNSKYEADMYPKIVEGAELEVKEVDGWLKVIDPNKPAGNTGGRGAGIAKAQETKRQDISDAQANRSEGIKLSGSARDATLMLTTFYADSQLNETEMKEKWSMWRDWFYREHDEVLPFDN